MISFDGNQFLWPFLPGVNMDGHDNYGCHAQDARKPLRNAE